MSFANISGSDHSFKEYPIPQSNSDLDFAELDRQIEKDVEKTKQEMLRAESEIDRTNKTKLTSKIMHTFKNLFKK